MPRESRQRKTLITVMHLSTQAIPDTELPPEFRGVDGIMQSLDLCLFCWERIHENKLWIQTCSLLFSRCVGSWGHDKGGRNGAWLWETSSQTGGSVWGSLKELLGSIVVFFHVTCTFHEKFLCYWMLRMSEAGKRGIHWGWCLLNPTFYRAAFTASTLRSWLIGVERSQLENGWHCNFLFSALSLGNLPLTTVEEPAQLGGCSVWHLQRTFDKTLGNWSATCTGKWGSKMIAEGCIQPKGCLSAMNLNPFRNKLTKMRTRTLRKLKLEPFSAIWPWWAQKFH